MQVYKQEHLVTFEDADEKGRIKLPTLINYMMQTSNSQLSHGHAGINELIKNNLGWVVVDYNFDIIRLPKAGENITFTTNVAGYNRFFAYRDFGALDEQGNKIINVKSQWVMLDLKERKMVEPDPKLMAEFDNKKLEKLPRFTRLHSMKGLKPVKEYQVRYYDLDTNHHLTNSHYFDWIIDSLDRDFLNTHTLTNIKITFKKEVTYGQIAKSAIKLDTENLVSYHQISHDQDVCAIAQLSWQNN